MYLFIISNSNYTNNIKFMASSIHYNHCKPNKHGSVYDDIKFYAPKYNKTAANVSRFIVKV